MKTKKKTALQPIPKAQSPKEVFLLSGKGLLEAYIEEGGLIRVGAATINSLPNTKILECLAKKLIDYYSEGHQALEPRRSRTESIFGGYGTYSKRYRTHCHPEPHNIVDESESSKSTTLFDFFIWVVEVDTTTKFLNGDPEQTPSQTGKFQICELIAQGEHFLIPENWEQIKKNSSPFTQETVRASIDYLRFVYDLHFGEFMPEQEAEAILKKAFSD